MGKKECPISFVKILSSVGATAHREPSKRRGKDEINHHLKWSDGLSLNGSEKGAKTLIAVALNMHPNLQVHRMQHSDSGLDIS